jgi:hypothetical protein
MALPTASDNAFPSFLVTEGTAPSSPAAGKQRLFIDSSDHLLKYKNSSGTVTAVAAAASGSITASGYTQSTAKLLGRSTASTGAIEEITVGTNLTLSAGTLSASGGSGISAGTSFPGSPATNDLFNRTDRGYIYYYDGTRWVTSQEFGHSLAVLDVLEPVSATNPLLFGSIDLGANGAWITRHVTITFASGTNNGSNFWTAQLNKRDGAGATTSVGGSFNTSADSANTWTRHDTTVGASITTGLTWALSITKTSAPSTIYATCTVYYRLIG